MAFISERIILNTAFDAAIKVYADRVHKAFGFKGEFRFSYLEELFGTLSYCDWRTSLLRIKEAKELTHKGGCYFFDTQSFGRASPHLHTFASDLTLSDILTRPSSADYIWILILLQEPPLYSPSYIDVVELNLRALHRDGVKLSEQASFGVFFRLQLTSPRNLLQSQCRRCRFVNAILPSAQNHFACDCGPFTLIKWLRQRIERSASRFRTCDRYWLRNSF